MPSTQHIPVLTLSVAAAAALVEHRAVGFDGNYAAADAFAYGITNTDVDSGDQVAITVQGTAIVEAGAACSVGDQMKVGTDGKLIPWATSGVVVGRALEAAGADGDKIEVLLTTGETGS